MGLKYWVLFGTCFLVFDYANMNEVEFSDEETLPVTRVRGARSGIPTGLIGLVVRTGVVRDAKGASVVLLIAALIASATAVGVFMSGLP